MRVLVFDTETTGLPKTKLINPDTLHLWPYIVQFSYVIYDTDLNDIVHTYDAVIKLNNGMLIPEDSTKIHGITNEMSQDYGLQINNVLHNFFVDLRNSDRLVGHNISFDINIVTIELLRLIYESTHKKTEDEIKKYKYDLHFLKNYKNVCCTLQESINICQIKTVDKFGKEYFKFPKLMELHKKLFETEPQNLHNSFTDILVTLRCFMKLKYDLDLNVICKRFIGLVLEMNIY
jgi:DNA polymerase III epsilon subunit-like protein